MKIDKMKLKKEDEVMEKVLDLKNEISLWLFNYQSEMTNIQHDMRNALDLLDEVSEGSEKAKKKLRKKILDTYNDLPRKSLGLINKLIKRL